MKKITGAIIAILLSIPVAFLLTAATDNVPRPDPVMTPGAVDPKVTQENIQQTICQVGYTKTVRNVPGFVKLAIFKEYGIDPARSGEFEIDHLVSLENGGSNDPQNLWPQPYAPKPGAREKDVLETHLKRLVCAGQLSLADDQHMLATDWYAAYLKFGLDKKTAK